MRFMIMHKNDPKTEAGQLPPVELITKMGEFIGAYAQSGRLIDGAGLGASKTRTRLIFRAGRCTVKHAKQKADLTRLKTEMTKAGVLVRELALQPSATAKRLVFTNSDLAAIDGPFTESKELIGGFAVLELSGMDEAIATCRDYAAILGGTLEIDIRLVAQNDETT